MTPAAPPSGPRLEITGAESILSDLDAEYGGRFSFDTTHTGLNTEIRYDLYPGDDGEFCRDHFKPIDLWWDGGWGIAVIHLDPPLLFRGYRSGTFKDRRGLVWRRAIYETVQPGEGQDPAGNVWRFHGRFNALCRGGSREIGPFVFNAHLLVSQDPIDKPVLVRRGDDCGGDTKLVHHLQYDPYASTSDDDGCTGGTGGGGEDTGTGTQYQPGEYTGGETVDWGTGTGNGGESVCGNVARVEYVCIDVYNEKTGGWDGWGCGYVTTC